MILHSEYKGVHAIAIATSKSTAKTVQIIPANNKISDEDWKVLKDHPFIKKGIKTGDLKVLKDEKVKEGNGSRGKDGQRPSKKSRKASSAASAEVVDEDDDDDDDDDGVTDLGGMNAKDAAKFVEGVTDADQLRVYLDNEDRSTVTDAIQKQLAKLADADDDNGDGDDENSGD